METIGTWWMWTGFAVFVVVAIAVDLLVMERQGAHKVTMKEAASWSVVWFSLAFVFVGWLWWYLDASHGRAVANTVSSSSRVSDRVPLSLGKWQKSR
mgnify:CR=1 FL=1